MKPGQSIAVGPTVIAWTALLLTLVSLAAWLTHIIMTFKVAAWGFLIGGAIVFPIGVVHGVGRWFGAW